MTEDERQRAADGLRRLLGDIEQGRLVASDTEAAYIAGALQALTEG
ncbi:hypothetical protein [Amnibacterium kyonggiense]|nr:hypothetical protein [Amnibacterium kyonggiense]